MTFAKKTEILSKYCARCTRSRDFLKCPEINPCKEYVELSNDLDELIAEVAETQRLEIAQKVCLQITDFLFDRTKQKIKDGGE